MRDVISHGPSGAKKPFRTASEYRGPQLGEDLADLGEQIVAVGPLERMDARAIPALVPVVGGAMPGHQCDRSDSGGEVGAEEEREREPIARGRVADAVGRG